MASFLRMGMEVFGDETPHLNNEKLKKLNDILNVLILGTCRENSDTPPLAVLSKLVGS